MANPFFEGTNIKIPNASQNNQSKKTLRQVYNEFKSMGKDPMTIFRAMASKNPQLQPILQLLNGGMSEEEVFNMLCQKRGLNPQDVLNSFL